MEASRQAKVARSLQVAARSVKRLAPVYLIRTWVSPAAPGRTALSRRNAHGSAAAARPVVGSRGRLRAARRVESRCVAVHRRGRGTSGRPRRLSASPAGAAHPLNTLLIEIALEVDRVNAVYARVADLALIGSVSRELDIGAVSVGYE